MTVFGIPCWNAEGRKRLPFEPERSTETELETKAVPIAPANVSLRLEKGPRML